MKVYSIYWDNGAENVLERERGGATVIASTITKAIARFQKEYHPDRIINSVNLEGDDVLLDVE